jgi:hypothetical protein
MYSPQPPRNAGDEYAYQELARLARSLQQMEYMELKVWHAAPSRVVEGTVVLADGTDWNPGSGKGLYAWLDGAWFKL